MMVFLPLRNTCYITMSNAYEMQYNVLSKNNQHIVYFTSLPSDPSTFTILCMYIFFMFSRAGLRY